MPNDTCGFGTMNLCTSLLEVQTVIIIHRFISQINKVTRKITPLRDG